MSFEYFQGPQAQMSDLEDAPRCCTFCSVEGKCFNLNRACWVSSSIPTNKDSYGCLECLTRGKFQFSHDTEVGYLSKAGLKHIYKHHKLGLSIARRP